MGITLFIIFMGLFLVRIAFTYFDAKEIGTKKAVIHLFKHLFFATILCLLIWGFAVWCATHF